jgi:hypothetical protein
MIALALLLAAATAEPDGYRWHTAMTGEIVQYGVPDTDDRALRIDCHEGRITILGPSAVDLDEDAPTSVSFRISTGEERRDATGVYMGDGMNFAAPVAADDPVLAALMRGEPLRISQGDGSWDVPGDGAAAELGPLIQSCRR